ncbi:MAG: hypothetical protein F2792_02760 [Actinobacteria bacterium]|nr:hypothetical protein [Actinomycetota bacterium]
MEVSASQGQTLTPPGAEFWGSIKGEKGHPGGRPTGSGVSVSDVSDQGGVSAGGAWSTAEPATPTPSVGKFLLSTKAVILHALLVVVAISFCLLAIWQWDRAHSRIVDPLKKPQVSIDQVSKINTAIVSNSEVGRSVAAAGTFDGQQTYVVLESTQKVTVAWAMTPLRLDDGSFIPVVHGALPFIDAGRQVAIPGGRIGVTGRLQASQDLGLAPSTNGLKLTYPKGQVLGGVATPEIAGLVDGPIRPGFIIASSESPAVQGVFALPDSSLVLPPRGLRVQNVLYTIQWSVFAFFALFVYIRLLRVEWRRYGELPIAAVSQAEVVEIPTPIPSPEVPQAPEPRVKTSGPPPPSGRPIGSQDS